MNKYSNKVKQAIIAASCVVKNTQVYAVMDTPTRDRLTMDLIGVLCTPQVFVAAGKAAPGNKNDCVMLILAALLRVNLDVKHITQSKPVALDAARLTLFSELDAVGSPSANNPLTSATLSSRMTWILKVCQRVEALAASAPVGADAELCDLTVSLEASKVLTPESCGMRITGKLRHVLLQLSGFFIHCRLFIISEVFGRREVVDFRKKTVFMEATRAGSVREGLRDALYYDAWLRVFETRRQDPGVASSVHAQFSDSFLWSPTPLGYRAWMLRCSPWQSSGGQIYIGPKLGVDKYTALLRRSATRGKDIKPDADPDLLNHWSLAQWCDFVRSHQMDIRSRTRSVTQLSALERAEQAVADNKSPFLDSYLVLWSEWGTEAAYAKVMQKRKMGEKKKPILCVLGEDTFGVRTDQVVYLFSDVRLAIAQWAHLCGPVLEGGMPTPRFD